MVACPDIGTLKIAERTDQPARKRQKRSCIHYCMVYDHFISFKNTRQNLTTQRESIGNIKMAGMMFFDIFNNLPRLIVY